jgi:hypothetical protein
VKPAEFKTFYPDEEVAGNAKTSIQTALFDHDILAHDQPMSSHLPQPWEYLRDMLVGIHEAQDDWQFTARFH